MKDPVKSNIEKIKDFCISNNKRPQLTTSDPEQKKLAKQMRRYINPNGNSYRKEFKAWLDEKYPIIDQVEINIQKIKDFCESNDKRPRKTKLDPEQKKLAQLMGYYINPSSGSYRKEFKTWLDEKFSSKFDANSAEINIQKIKDFCKSKDRRPQQTKKDSDEFKLAQSMQQYINPNGKSYRKELKEWLDEKYPIIDTVKSNIEKIKDFCISNNKRPQLTKSDPEQNKLAKQMWNYIYPNGDSYRKEFKEWLDEKYPIIGGYKSSHNIKTL